MDSRKIVVLVEDVEASRTALRWALHNLVRYDDVMTLLHVFPSMTKKKKRKKVRLKGYQLALSFREICNNFPNTKTEIIVTEGDEEGGRIAAVVAEIGASTLVVGLHDRSFLYRLCMAHNSIIANNFNCKVLAIKQPTTAEILNTRRRKKMTISMPADNSLTNFDFSQIEIAALSIPDVTPPKIPYKICPDPSAIMWRSMRRRRRRNASSK